MGPLRRIIAISAPTIFLFASMQTSAPVSAATTTSTSTSTSSTTTLAVDPLATSPALPYGSDGAPAKGLNRYIVRYRDTATTSEIDSVLKKNGGTRKRQLAKVFNGDVLDLTPGQANQLNKETSSVLWVERPSGHEPNQRATKSVVGSRSHRPALTAREQHVLLHHHRRRCRRLRGGQRHLEYALTIHRTLAHGL